MNARNLSVFGNFFIVFLIALGTGLTAIFFSKDNLIVFLQLSIIAYFSFLPAWIYLQFISTKGKTLWDEYVLNLYRLRIDHFAYLPQPPTYSLYYHSWKDSHESVSHHYDKTKLENKENNHLWENIYQKKFESLYGVAPVDDFELMGNDFKKLISLKGESLYFMGPVMVATLIISVCWTLVVEPLGVSNMEFMEIAGAEKRFSEIFSFNFQTFKFGILGAYFYILQMLIRRFFQNDLRRNAYVSVIMRYIVVILLVWVMDVLLKNTYLETYTNTLAFVVGVFPHIGWKVIVSLIKLPVKIVVPSLQQDYPLSDLDGLNIWYESRLLEEGIEDMQNLATANLVDLMLNTRIPVERLVDWVDQSILYLHLGTQEKNEAKHRKILRQHGIRNATDLDDIFFNDEGELNTKLTENKISEASLKRIANDPLIHILDSGPNGAPVLLSIIKALKRSPNLYHIRQWKRYSQDQMELFEMIKKDERLQLKLQTEGVIQNMHTELFHLLNGLKEEEAIEAEMSQKIMSPINTYLHDIKNKPLTHIEFINKSDNTLFLLWIDQDKKVIPYTEIRPKASHKQQTFKEHKWVIRKEKEGNTLYEAIGEKEDTQLIFENDRIFKNGKEIREKVPKKKTPAAPKG
ncbi:MAG: hypothetical protein R8P61_37515 [Bacteroidia bacterium]|nr:hypothetical protein [Bacteroidia bacterium]